MRVLHLSTHARQGGAAIAAFRQHKALTAIGVDSTMLVRFRESSDPSIKLISPSTRPIARLSRGIRRHKIAKAKQLALTNSRQNFIEFSSCTGDILGNEIKSQLSNSDLINIHHITPSIDLTSLLLNIPQAVPIVITMHDMNPFTGGCHYSNGCVRFQQQCGSCHLLVSGEKTTQAEHARKRSAYASIGESRLHFVAISNWHYDAANTASLTQYGKTSLIHHGIDSSVFNPTGRENAKSALGWDERPIIMFGAAQSTSARKGATILSNALKRMDGSACRIVTFGDKAPEMIAGFEHAHFRSIENESLLAVLYRAADVFVAPSREEAFGLTALEATACGALIVVSQGTGLEDIVENGANGFAASVEEPNSFATAIDACISNKEMKDSWAKNCEQFIESKFSSRSNAEKYLELYEHAVAEID